MRVYYHPSVGDYAKYDSFELDHAALVGVPSGIAVGVAGWAFKRASWEALLASLGGGGLMAGAFGAFYPKKILSWFNPPPFDAPIVYPRETPKTVVPSYIGDTGQVLNLLYHEGAGNIVKDYSPYKNHGTIYGASWVDGPWGWALSFKGNNYVIVPYSNSLNIYDTKKVTVEMWVYVIDDSLDGYIELLTRGYQYQVIWRSDDNTPYFQWKDSAGNVRTWFKSGLNLPLNTWHHIVFSMAFSNTGTCYEVVDGTVVYSGATSYDVTQDTTSNIRTPEPTYIGLIALSRVNNLTLSPDESKRRYEATKPIFT
jgi:hypothetical protein